MKAVVLFSNGTASKKVKTCLVDITEIIRTTQKEQVKRSVRGLMVVFVVVKRFSNSA